MEVLLPLLLVLPPSAGAMIMGALIIGVSMVGLMFIFAYALSNPQLIAVAKEEFASLLFTVFIVLFWLTSDAFLNGIVYGLMVSTLEPEYRDIIDIGGCVSGEGAGCVQGLANSHLTLALASLDVIDQKLRSQYIDLYLFEALIGFLSTISFPIGSPFPGISIVSFTLAPFTGLTLLSNAHTTVVESIGYIITLVWAKKFIVIFSKDVVPVLLLPLGLVLRAIPFFRRTGSSIIAVAFAMYYVLPFALILSNYLIFDIFQPADFSYTPTSASFFDTERDADYWEQRLAESKEGPTELRDEHWLGKDVVEETYDEPTDECSGNFIVRMFCSVKNILSTAIDAVVGFIKTVWNIWRFMVGMTGDFLQNLFLNPAMPASASAGLYYFIVKEVTTVTPLMILVILTTVIEIIITVTMYRNISLLIGGEAELIGLTKIV